ncbi:MAG TPA: MBL fold metallo-hydrolase [Hyphomicrobiaceae bacterium]|nr:MBL fold metallo-hydrolase [Hyphomicrobiaceae bacterium]
MRSLRRMCAILVSATLTFAAVVADAAAAPLNRCQAIARAPGLVQPVSTRPVSLGQGEVRITFIGHSTFLIESQRGVSIATDYNDVVRPSGIPDIVTMNRAHSTHYTDYPSPEIKYVLRGWNPAGGPARHDIEYKDVNIRNVPTNIRDWGGNAISYGNSIFIFEIAGLCIGHLGHLHHTLNPEQIAAIGQLDVVLVPVDGGYTMDVAGMIDVLRALRARLIIPMHYFNSYTLARFTEKIKSEFPIEQAPMPMIVVSKWNLPEEAKVLVLPGQ